MKLLIVGTGAIVAFAAACLLAVYALTDPGAAPAGRAPSVASEPASWDLAGALRFLPTPAAEGAPQVRQLTLPGVTGSAVPPAPAPAAGPKAPFDPAAHEQKRLAKREMMNRRRNGPPSSEVDSE